MKVLIIIPTYNEAENVIGMIQAIKDVDSSFEILIVDDHSPDGTAKITNDRYTNADGVFILNRNSKEGLGRAYLAGFQWALSYDYGAIITMDCDFSHHPQEIPKMLAKLDDYACVVGSRYVKGGRVINWPFNRLFLSYLASIYVRLILGLPVLDPTGGFNCYHMSILRHLQLQDVFSSGYSFQVELKYRLWKSGFATVEHPITFNERRYGKSKMGLHIIGEALVNIIRLRIHQVLGRL